MTFFRGYFTLYLSLLWKKIYFDQNGKLTTLDNTSEKNLKSEKSPCRFVLFNCASNFISVTSSGNFSLNAQSLLF